MKNSAYWKLRFEQLEAASNKNAVETFSTIEEQFMAAQKELEQQISTWYTRFAKNNGITMQEARQLLTTKQLAEFKWDVKEFIKYGEENALDGAWMKQLENASARFHVSRLEALKMQTQQTVEKLFGGQTDALDALLKKNYLDTYYHTAYEIQKGISIGWDIAAVDNRTLERLISKPWSTDGKNFSERIWSNKANLINEVQTQLTQTIMLGKSPDDAIKAIAKKMGTSKNQAGRLVMTESAYFSSQSQKDCFNELDVEQFEIVATLDSHTSEICQQMDGQVFPMKDFEPGVTAPPFHPWCRSTTVPYFDDNFTERAARGADGKTYYVDSKLKYPEWKQTFTEGGSKDGLTAVSADELNNSQKPAIIREKKEIQPSDFPSEFTATKAEQKNTQALVDYINGYEGANPDTVDLYRSMGKLENLSSNNIPFSIAHGKNCAVTQSYSVYSGNLSEVKLTIPKLQGENLTGQVCTTLHEEMHLMDLYCRKDAAKSGNWFSASSSALEKAFKASRSGMSDDVSRLFKDFNAEYKKIYDDAYDAYKKATKAASDAYDIAKNNGSWSAAWKEYKKATNAAKKVMTDTIDYAARNACGGGVSSLQDIYDALSEGVFRDNGTVKYGHGSKYYRSVSSQLEETLANYGALSIARPDLIDMLRKDKPELVKALEELVSEMLRKAGA